MRSEHSGNDTTNRITIRIPLYVVATAVCGFSIGVLDNHYAVDWLSLTIGVVATVVVLAAIVVAD